MAIQPNEYKPYWEVVRDGIRIAHGPKETMPDARERKMFREAGIKLHVEGKLFREEKGAGK